MPASRIALIPLDDRPVTGVIPARIGAMAGFEVSVPPRELLGNLQRAADLDALGAWLTTELPRCQAAVLALDTLAFGGLIPSRQGNEPLGLVRSRLSFLRRLREAHPEVLLLAFAVSTRLSAHAAPEEEKPYWREHGEQLYRYSFHLDRYAELGDPEDRALGRFAQEKLPREVLADYLAMRRRNADLLFELVGWMTDEAFDRLLVTSDDSGTFGLNVAERRDLREHIESLELGDRVLIHPGADEVASVLVGYASNRLTGRTPGFAVHWSTPAGPGIVAMYEDRPLSESLAGQIQAVGGALVREDADCQLFLDTPASGQGDLALGLDLEKVDTPSRDLAPFVADLRVALASGRCVALADVAFANGADLGLMERLAPEDLLSLAAYGAWNTAGNTMGTVLAAASAALAPEADAAARRRFLRERLADDYLYQAILRPQLQAELAQGGSIKADELSARLEALWQQRLPGVPSAFAPIRLPWNRLFEVEALEIEGARVQGGVDL